MFTSATVADIRDSSHRSPGPRCATSGVSRTASAATLSGHAPSTYRAAFHSLFAKFLEFSSFWRPSFRSLPGAVPWTSAKRSASAPNSSIVAIGSTTLPFVFDIFWPYGSRTSPDR